MLEPVAASVLTILYGQNACCVALKPVSNILIGAIPVLEQIRTVDGEVLLPLPEDALTALGLQSGGQVKITVVGQALVVQLPDAEPVDSDFLQTFKGVLEQRQSAYKELA